MQNLSKLFIQKLILEENKALPNPDLYASTLVNPYDNRENLPPGYIDEILAGMSERKRKRFMNGEWLDDLEGALWKRAMINDNRIVNIPDRLIRIVVAIDPAVTANENSDDTGIIVAGKDRKGHYYILDDVTAVQATPYEWGEAAVKAYRKYKADRVIGEVNNCGDLAEVNIRNIKDARTVSYKSVRASRGKFVRAEPIAALYEQGLVHHIGEFPQLEDQMCNFNPLTTDKSPDRMDALVWALWELSGGVGGGSPLVMAG